MFSLISKPILNCITPKIKAAPKGGPPGGKSLIADDIEISTKISFAIDLIIGISLVIAGSYILSQSKGYSIASSSLLTLGILEIGAVFGAAVFRHNHT